MYCQVFSLRRDLWGHVRKCFSKQGNTDDGSGRNWVLSLATVLESAMCQQVSPGVWKLLSTLKDDEITSAVRSDLCVLQLDNFFFNKHGQDPTKYDYIR